MRFEGVLPEDAPDPRIEQARRLELMPVPIVGLVLMTRLSGVRGTELAELCAMPGRRFIRT
ncbi:hypothetical protein [Pseudarthrobacter sp. N5]|uniref:hypothetical protein n=1 Tax=Pseudarthrobacter sp. N5 TaxID=3418416 RepID=UPI003CF4405F